MMRSISNQRPLAAPARPAPLPARLMSVQGHPPTRTCTRSRLAAPACLTSLTALLAPGQCRARLRLHHSSISTCHRHSAPVAHSTPSARPSTPPENREPSVGRSSVASSSSLTWVRPSCAGAPDVPRAARAGRQRNTAPGQAGARGLDLCARPCDRIEWLGRSAWARGVARAQCRARNAALATRVVPRRGALDASSAPSRGESGPAPASGPLRSCAGRVSPATPRETIA
jgi:hypothetical protein